MAISTQKLLSPAKSSSIKVSSSIVKVSNLGSLSKKNLMVDKPEESNSSEKLVSIYDTLINIGNYLNARYKNFKNNNKEEKLLEDKKEKKSEEDILEKRKDKSPIKFPKINLPFASFFDRIKNAIVMIFFGWLINRFFEYIPKIIIGVSNFIKKLEEINKFLKPATDALGSALYNVTLAGTKMLGAITGAQIDKNEKDLFVAINELDKKFSIVNALMAAIVIGDIFSAVSDGLDLFERPGKSGPGAGGGRGGKYSYDPKRALIRKKYGDSFAKLYDLERAKGLNATQSLKNVLSRYVRKGRIIPQRMLGSLGGGIEGSNIFARGIRRAPVRIATRVLGRGGIKIASKIFSRIPIIGGLIDFLYNVFILREKPGRAAAKAVGSTLGAALGAAVAGGATFGLGAIVGATLGGLLGDIVGGSLYDAVSSFTDQKPKRKKYFLGGVIGAIGNFFSGRKTVSKPSPSRNVGLAQKAIQQTNVSTQTIASVNPQKQIVDLVGNTITKSFVNISNLLSSVPYIGAFAALGINLSLGQSFTKANANAIAAGIGNLLGNPLSFGIYKFLNKTMPGLGNLVQKTAGKAFPIFLSNWITQYLGNEIYKSISPLTELIKITMLRSKQESQKAAKEKDVQKDSQTGNVTPMNVPAGKDEKIKAAIKFYKSKGFSDSGAAYMVGNLLQESQLDPAAKGDNGKAFGLAQWRIDAASGARWLGYLDWAKKSNKNPGDFYSQLEYTVVEGQTYNAGLKMMKGNSKEDHKIFIKNYEGYSEEGNRFGFAEDILKNSQKYGLIKQGGETKSIKPTQSTSADASIAQTKPSSISANSYSAISRRASYDRNKLQVIRDIVYVPMNQSQSTSQIITSQSSGVNNIDKQILDIVATN